MFAFPNLSWRSINSRAGVDARKDPGRGLVKGQNREGLEGVLDLRLAGRVVTFQQRHWVPPRSFA
jgi:hypothetical protein